VCGSQKVFKRPLSQAHKFYFVCNAHFEINDYRDSARKRLKHGALPKLHLPAPFHDVNICAESNENIESKEDLC